MRKMLQILTIFLLTIFSVQSSFSTAQQPDILYYNNDTLYLYANPLESYYTDKTRPESFFGNKSACISTACWRGYVAFWTIENNLLYLSDLKSCCYSEDSIKADLASLFGEKYKNGKVKADWLTGEIIAPQGKLIHYEHMGYSSIYEKELALILNKGYLIDTKIYDNSRSIRSELEIDPDKLKNFIYSKIDWNKLPDLDKQEVKIYAQISTNNYGKVDSVQIVKSSNERYNQEIIRVLKEIPQWSVFYKHGEFVKMKWVLPIFIDERIRKKYGS